MTDSITNIRARIADARREAEARGISSPRVVLVPTMGALHDGHLRLVDEAKKLGEIVVVSIFVNPLQFGPHEDLSAYPRTLDADVARLAEHDVHLVFAPTPAEMYPDGDASTRVTAGEVGFTFEGRTRPGHFDGMLTVVSKLFHIVSPDVAVFGEKDRQQLFLVKRMVKDLNVPVEVHGVAIVRADDGLALSSRNAFLSEGERRSALVLSAALDAAEFSQSSGVDAALAAAHSVLDGETSIDLDYLAAVDPETFSPVDDTHVGQAVLLIAARVGTTRLIDNRTLAVS
ncbi:pantoate--beta-alanine ligase [Mycetocola zhadangensis]|uniref:Pantothenate synthetase n=1 Tax=Mycetocola zhadangensis TaxID=1164595 RepID=A0A3L7J7X5_9MICO|nr:pantoate--beta-alanine ligase [Mycetocola zhadangensis]RLQ84602.1 pantoate--beta-alanine ligase [Mycetocola zhadangensis]GGE91518.1 pantothenate synthetase [Mycetocola zhadangensis]